MATKPAYIDPVTGTPIYGDYVSDEQKVQTEPVAAPIDAASGLVIGSPEYQRFQDQREMRLQKGSSLGNELPVNAETGIDNMQAMRGLTAADYSVGAQGSTYAPGLLAAADQISTGGTISAEIPAGAGAGGKKVVSTIVNAKGENVAVYEDGTTQVLGQAVDKIAERKSAFDLLKEEFTRYGLQDLVGETQALAVEGVSPAEFTLRLRQTPTYVARFSANADRIKAGYRSLSEAEYVTLEDQYQRTMRQYGLPESFYKTGTAGRQPELEKFLAGDVSPAELEDRIQLGVNRVQNASPEVLATLEQFYPGVNKSNLLAYMLDPKKALPDIQRQVQAAEIGGAARLSGLSTNLADAQYLASYGVDQAQARTGYQQIAGGLERGGQLANIYGQTPYTQTTAEQEVFGTGGAADARRKRQKISGLEQATFGGQSGLSSSALNQGRAGAF